MNIDIFYFTGTGNSLFVARQLSDVLVKDNVRIVAIKKYLKSKKVEIKSDCVIIVYPVYFQTLPDLIKKFVNKLDFDTTSIPIYGIATCNAGPGHSLFTLNRILLKKGQFLRAGFTIDMPGNALIIRDLTNPYEIREQRLKESCHKIKEIYEYINKDHFGKIEGNDSFKYHLKGITFRTIAKYIYRTPSKLKNTKACTKCGSCIRVCPTGNIAMGKEGVEWGSNCEQCLACFHWCPKMAVEIGKYTDGKLRYHHPDISINDVIKVND